MDRKTIANMFEDDEKNEALGLYDKYILAFEKDITVLGNSFYPPNIWSYFQNLLVGNLVKMDTYGFFEESERRMICFNNMYNVEFPVKVIKVENKSKFKRLTHRDYLGAILSLGVKRNKIGDLLVKDDECYFPICEEIEDFIISNLSKVGNCPVKVSLAQDNDVVPCIELTEEIIQVQSLRIDSIVSKLSKTSRSKAQEIIDEGKVLVNYSKTRDKSKEIKVNDRITIRGIGKFILGEQVGNTKSNKIKIKVKKYT